MPLNREPQLETPFSGLRMTAVEYPNLGEAAERVDEIKTVVQEKYGSVARAGRSSRDQGVRAVAEAFGYSPDELASIPAEANMGLSCGNPTAYASLKPGETVVDLGCGGGLDVFLAARRVGPTGRAIGIDMTPEMIALARSNSAKAAAGKPMVNVEFHLASIDELPLANGSVDCVISNCVINLAPDKGRVFREAYRVLKPGGRFAVSDIALRKELPPEMAADIEAYVGCIAGAMLIEDYRRGLIEAGFGGVEIVETGSDLNAYSKAGSSTCCSTSQEQESKFPVLESSCCGSPKAGDVVRPSVLSRFDVNEFAASVRVFAVKSEPIFQ